MKCHVLSLFCDNLSETGDIRDMEVSSCTVTRMWSPNVSRHIARIDPPMGSISFTENPDPVQDGIRANISCSRSHGIESPKKN